MERVPLPMQGNTADGFDQMPEEFSRGEAVGAAFDLALEDTLGILAYRGYEQSQIEKMDSKQLTADEANAQFPMQQPFTKPITFATAKYLQMAEQDNIKLQMKIQNGPDDFYTAAAQFGAGLLAHAMDPLEQAASLGVGGFVGGALVKTAWGAKIATRAGLAAELPGAVAAPSLGARTAFNVMEAGAGNLIENIGQEIVTADILASENRAYDMDGGMVNIAASTFFGTMLGVGIKEGSFQLNRVLRNTTPDADLAMVRGIVGQVKSEVRPDVEPLVKAMAQETDVKVNYEFQPATKETIPQKQFFAVAAGSDFATSNKMVVGEAYFGGTQLTDNPGVANAASIRSLSQTKGLIHPVELSELNPLDLDQMIPENLQSAFVEAFKGVGNVEKLIDGMPAKRILDALMDAVDDGRVDPSVLAKLQEHIKAAGFDSTVHNGTSVAGFEHSPHNVLTVFDNERLSSKGFHTPDPKLINTPDQKIVQEQANARTDYKKNMFIDMEALEQFRKEQLEDVANRPDPIAEVDDLINEFKEEFKLLEQQGLDTPEMRLEIERLDDIEKQGVAELTAIKALAACGRR